MALLANLEALLARGQDNALLRFGLGSAYLKQEQFAQAVIHLRKALEFDPHYSAAWKMLGQALAAAGEREQALATFTQGSANAEAQGDIQAAKEMRVYLKRLNKT